MNISDATGPQRHVAQILKQLAAQLPLNTAQPPVVFDAPMGGNYMEQFAPAIVGADNPNSGAIALTGRATRDITNRVPAALASLIHELAHANQSADTFAKGASAYEGGADAFARLMAPGAIKRSGLSPAGDLAAAVRAAHVTGGRGNPNYDSFVQTVLNQLGRAWVLGGQFGR